MGCVCRLNCLIVSPIEWLRAFGPGLVGCITLLVGRVTATLSLFVFTAWWLTDRAGLSRVYVVGVGTVMGASWACCWWIGLVSFICHWMIWLSLVPCKTAPLLLSFDKTLYCWAPYYGWNLVHLKFLAVISWPGSVSDVLECLDALSLCFLFCCCSRCFAWTWLMLLVIGGLARGKSCW